MQITWDEQYLRHDDPGGKTYYIIRRFHTEVGLFSNYIIFAGHIRYALANGWLPVIDMKHYPNAYLEPQLLGKVNAWEYYFCQPFNITLDEAYSGRNIILCDGIKNKSFPSGSMNYFNNVNNELTEWRMLVKLGLLRIQPKMYESIMAEYNSLISKDDRVLGVKLRGTDYFALKPKDHHIQPPIDFALNTIKNLKTQWKCNKIFLATEDKNIFQRFKEEFGDECITSQMAYVDYDGKGFINAYNVTRENSLFLKGKEYLTQIVILSKCKNVALCQCSGTVGLMMMTDGFEQAVVFDLGRYGAQIAPPFVIVITRLSIKIKNSTVGADGGEFFLRSNRNLTG